MGKYVVLVVVASLSVWGLSMSQLQSEQQAAEDEAEHHHWVLARQVARTGLNVIRARASQASKECPDAIVDAVSPVQGTDNSGDYSGGTYKAELDSVSAIDHTFRAVSEGTYRGAIDTVETLVEVDAPAAGGILYADDGSIKQSDGEGNVSGFSTSPQAQAMGPLEVNLDEDGRKEIPYVPQDSAMIKMVDPDGDEQTLVNADYNGPKKPATSETRLAVGRWGSSDPSVFYANSNNDAIYKVSDEGEPELVAEPSNSAQAVVGISDVDGSDVDGDNGEEFVFVDGSQQLRYIEESGAETSKKFTKIDGGGAGSNNGVGAGALVDQNNDGTSSVVLVDGSGNLKLVNAKNNGEECENGNKIKVANSDKGAAKVPPTVLDVDGDGGEEIAYISSSEDNVQYVDANPKEPCSPEVHTMSNISADKGAGLQSIDTTSPCGGS